MAAAAANAPAAGAPPPPPPAPPPLPPIDGAAVAALVIFLCSVAGVIALVLLRPAITLRPRRGRPPLRLRVPHWAAPPAGALLLLAARALDGPGFVAGIRGDAAIQPWAILVLFLSLAYCAAALDQTGAFAWLALRMTRAASTGPRLFALHSALSGAVTLATSNDVVVMSLTPIVYVQAAASGADPLPFLAAEFVAANLWSMALYVGNPTNIIVAQAFNMSFLDYSKWMLAPTAAAGVTAAAVLYATHRRAVSIGALSLPRVAPADVLLDPPGAVLLTALLALCLGLLAAAPAIGVPMWAVALACAGAAGAYNVAAYAVAPRWRAAAARRALPGVRSAAALLPPGDAARDGGTSSRHAGLAFGGGGGGGCKDAAAVGADGGGGAGEFEAQAGPWARGRRGEQQQQQQQQSIELSAAAAAAAAASSRLPPGVPENGGSGGGDGGGGDGASEEEQEQPPDAPDEAAEQLRARLTARPCSLWRPFSEMPWDCAPLVLGFFVLVEGLSANGWLERLGALLGRGATRPAAALWCLGGASILLANLVNNQPQTIALTRACLTPSFAAAAASAGAAPAAARRRLQAALFAVVVGSNTAACFSVIGALAGIMWVSIARSRGLAVSYPRFTRLMLPAGAAATVAALLVLTAEFELAPL
ncbi:hypothetical protein Rsub_08007 [Raphidocelis subcapitata]|uniref:Citrate transporter-like domain-containing protein n=1 Tax=Raphidocelis subcapitata TaxID=307507 RepID=A0A2V0PCJ9_9CHLO|nr:hypothetical protein Rsub_08007 [Raphidocelis subcapitata]|eukprot:GBF94835.1 hypothetical protein Rsub_08007 [Raphidocelis subcapitata]